MICPKCSFENPSSASYCMNCGTRLDGKVMCPNCRSLVDPETEVCPKCGTKIPSDKDLAITDKDKHFDETRRRHNKVWNIVLTASFMFAFLLSLALVFGRVVNIPTEPHKSIFSDADVNSYSALYYMFFQWKSVKHIASYIHPSKLFETWFLPIFRCVAVTLNIVATYVAAIFGIVKGIKELKKKSECQFCSYLYAAIILASNALTLTLINSTYYGMTGLERSANGEITNLLVLFSFLILVAMVYRTYYIYNKNKKALFVQKIIFSFSIFFALAIISYLGQRYIVYDIVEGSISNDVGISYLFVELISNVIQYQNSMSIATLSLCAVSVLIELDIRLLLGGLLIYFIKGFFDTEEESLKFKLPVYCGSIIVFILSIFLFLIALLTSLLYKGYILGYDMDTFDAIAIIRNGLKCRIGVSVISTVSSSFMMLGCSMASFFIVKSYNKNMKIINDKKLID